MSPSCDPLVPNVLEIFMSPFSGDVRKSFFRWFVLVSSVLESAPLFQFHSNTSLNIRIVRIMGESV